MHLRESSEGWWAAGWRVDSLNKKKKNEALVAFRGLSGWVSKHGGGSSKLEKRSSWQMFAVAPGLGNPQSSWKQSAQEVNSSEALTTREGTAAAWVKWVLNIEAPHCPANGFSPGPSNYL